VHRPFLFDGSRGVYRLRIADRGLRIFQWAFRKHIRSPWLERKQAGAWNPEAGGIGGVHPFLFLTVQGGVPIADCGSWIADFSMGFS
jgi:hypothetical protein